MWLILAVLIVLQNRIEKVVQRDAPTADLELRMESIRKKLADPNRSVEARAGDALEEAEKLDQQAQASSTERERELYNEAAVALLDEFNASHPRHSLTLPLALQAGVFVWADGRRLLDLIAIDPKILDRQERARRRVDESIRRLEAIEPALSGADPIIAQNGRFRLAQALADRSRLEISRSPEEKNYLDRVLKILDPVPSEPTLAGFARLLKVETLIRLNRPDQAEDDLDSLIRLKLDAPAPALVEARIELLNSQRRFPDALKIVKDSTLDDVAKACLILRIRLEERQNRSSSSDRTESEMDVFRQARVLLASPRSDASAALALLARSIDRPSSRGAPADWEVLAEIASRMNEVDRAVDLLRRGSESASNRSEPVLKGQFLSRSGAILFQAERFEEASQDLAAVWNDPKSGESRPKAGMLRALAHARALAAGQTWTSRNELRTLLNEQVRVYPFDAASVEAHWLLGNLELQSGKIQSARKHWESIPAGHPRWLSSQIKVATLNQQALDELRISGGNSEVRTLFREANQYLQARLQVATVENDRSEIELALIRLELTPGPGRPELARLAADRVIHRSGTAEQKARARGLRIVALAMSLDFTESETSIRTLNRDDLPETLMEPVRLLDHAAVEIDSVADRSRFGRVSRLLIETIEQKAAPVPQPLVAELKLRAIRALIAAGEVDAARRGFREIANWNPTGSDDSLFRDLAETYLRLNSNELAIEVERYRGKALVAGGRYWLESKYRLALANYNAGHKQEARKVIEAVGVLYPELGGGSLKLRFERLRQRLDEN